MRHTCELMTPWPLCVAADNTAAQAGELFRRHGFLDMARDINRGSSRQGPISVSMTFRPRSRGQVWLDTRLFSREEFELKVDCGDCGSRIAVIGSAFFCAACGHSAAERMFDQALEKVRLKFEKAPEIRLHLEGLGERDHGAVLERSILESALSDCVVALQRLAEQLYQRFPDVSQPRMNAFQRLGDLDRLWLAASGEGLDSWIEDGERSQLNLLYQRRHLLAHTDGVVDSRYLERSGDQVYRVGQRLVVHARDVRRLVELISGVGAGLRRTAPKG